MICMTRGLAKLALLLKTGERGSRDDFQGAGQSHSVHPSSDRWVVGWSGGQERLECLVSLSLVRSVL